MLRIPVEAGIAAGASAWIDIDLAALAHNVREFLRLLRPDCRLIAVVKANAYGHGAVPVARAALQAGAAGLAVGSVAEGSALREAGVLGPILVVGPVAPEEARAAVVGSLVPGLGGADLARALQSHAVRPAPVQIEVDTGMQRHGVPWALLREFVAGLRERGRLDLQGIYTHFAALDAAALPLMLAQQRRFEHALANVRDLGSPWRHSCNTLAALCLPAAHLDAVRIGGGLYGFDPLRAASPLRLRPVLSLKARCLQLRDAAVGETVGYGGTFVCRRPSRLALLPIGYADGLARTHWHGAEVLVRGRRVPIAGLVSMNQTVVDVTDVPAAAAGDECVLLGKQGDECVRAEERAAPGSSTYEVTALLRADLPRRLLGAGPAEERAAERGHGPRR